MTWAKIAVTVIVAGLTAGCAPQTTYRVDNVTYRNKEDALAASRRQEDAIVSQVKPSAQKVAGTALLVLPTTSVLRRNTGSTTNNADLNAFKATLNMLADFTEITMASNGKALEKGQIFDKLTTIYADDGDGASVDFGEADYKLFREKISPSMTAWTLTKRNGSSSQLVLPKDGNRLIWLNGLIIATVNAAADLGAPVTRQPLPESPNSARSGPSSGTGFFIDANGHALTNSHVVENCKSIKMTLAEGRKVDATVAAKDMQNDLALLTVSPPPAIHAQFSPQLARPGEDVVVFGFPLVGALSTQGNLSTGIISALVGLRDDSRLLQISAPVQPGNSGGPVLDNNGNVIAVVSSKINALKVAAATGDIPQNVNFAIKSSIVFNFLETNGVKINKATTHKTQTVADIGDQAKAFTHMVTCDR